MPLAPQDPLDSRRLRYFMQVLECGSVRGAAELLDMDPSAVSRAIALLEQECGTHLLERHGRGVRPTEAGLLLADYQRRQNGEQRQLLAQFDSIRKLERGHIDIVAGEGFIDRLMGNSLRGFMAEHPGVTVDIDIGNTDAIVSRIVDQHAHIGLVFQPPHDERLRTHHAHRQPINALVPDTHPLTQLRRPLLLADLAPYPGAMLHRGFGVRQHIEAAEISEGLRLQPVLTTTSFNAIAHFVVAGLGYALGVNLPMPAHNSKARIVALPMANPLLSQGQAKVITRQGRQLPPAAAALLECIVADFRLRAPE